MLAKTIGNIPKKIADGSTDSDTMLNTMKNIETPDYFLP